MTNFEASCSNSSNNNISNKHLFSCFILLHRQSQHDRPKSITKTQQKSKSNSNPTFFLFRSFVRPNPISIVISIFRGDISKFKFVSIKSNFFIIIFPFFLARRAFYTLFDCLIIFFLVRSKCVCVCACVCHWLWASYSNWKQKHCHRSFPIKWRSNHRTKK